jgi:hypothetical protein
MYILQNESDGKGKELLKLCGATTLNVLTETPDVMTIIEKTR